MCSPSASIRKPWPPERHTGGKRMSKKNRGKAPKNSPGAGARIAIGLLAALGLAAGVFYWKAPAPSPTPSLKARAPRGAAQPLLLPRKPPGGLKVLRRYGAGSVADEQAGQDDPPDPVRARPPVRQLAR